MKKLPIGIQTFDEIREEDYLYVDKTDIVYQLINKGKYYFLSRPRRFGKSLLISTLQALFEGREKLFKDLAIYKKWDWSKRYPVIKISFGGVARNIVDMKQLVQGILRSNQARLQVSCKASLDGGVCLRELIEKTHKKYGQKVVILVDEYDKLILDNLDQIKIAKEGREVLKDLYTTIKDSDEYIRFAFLTGVSKFSKVSVFSGLNNLQDITLDKRYATICGYTQNDLETTFANYLYNVDMDKVRLWYNGYNFLGESVYNPFDILLFIDGDFIFRNYWFKTGTPTFLIKLIQQYNYFIPQLNQLLVSESIIDSYDIEKIKLEPILFQAGYLTIDRQINTGALTMYQLRFPNLETYYSFNDYVLDYLTGQTNEKAMYQSDIFEALTTANIDTLKQTVIALFSSIPYNNYVNNTISSYEGYYSSVIYAYFASLGLDVIAEDVTNKGRIDLTIKLNNNIYIIEFKVDGKEQALKQIKTKKYHEKYQEKGKTIYIIGIDFSSQEKNVTCFAWEQVGDEDETTST